MESKDKYVLVLDASQLKTFGHCELEWAYSNREHLEISALYEATKTNPLDMGSFMHLLLEAYYKCRLKYPQNDDYTNAQVALQAWYKYKLPGDEHSLVENWHFKDDIKFIQERFKKYVFFYQGRDLVPVMNDGIPGVELGFSKVLYEDDIVLFVVEGKIDLVHQIAQDTLCIVDHKYQGRMNNLYEFRPQMKTYAWATGINHCLINYVRGQKEISKDTFVRTYFEVPNWMIKQWEKHMLDTFHYIYMRDSHPIELNENKFRRNFSSCAGAFESNPCQYRLLCETESDAMRENIKTFKYEIRPEWKPWKIEELGIKV